MNVQDVCAAFLDYCANERQLSQNTLSAYRQDLAEFTRFIGQLGIDAVGAEKVKGYARYLATERGLAAATVKRRLACLRAMFVRLVRIGALPASPFAGLELRIRLPARLPRCLGRGEIVALLHAADRAPDTTRLATMLLFATGVRVGELASLTIGDIDLMQRSLRIRGKGNRERQVFLPDASLAQDVQDYITRRAPQAPASQPLLVNAHGRPASAASIRTRVKRLAHRAALARRVTPHMLRHTAATALLEAGIDIRIVQRLLGHRSIATTELYTHVSDTALKAAVARADVRNAVLRGEANAAA
jgi:site-specific recombinase XerD